MNAFLRKSRARGSYKSSKQNNVTANAAVVSAGAYTTNGNAGVTGVSAAGSTITIGTCIEEPCSTTGNTQSNTVLVE